MCHKITQKTPINEYVDQEPIVLLYKVETKKQPGHYQLLLKKTSIVNRSDLRTLNSDSVFSAAFERKTVSLVDIVVDRQFEIPHYTDTECVNFSSQCEDLVGSSNVSEANVSAANVSAANVSAANVCEANVSAANVSAANVSADYVSAANVSAANVNAANVSAANVSAANVSATNVSAANVSSTNVSATNVCEANVGAANVSATNVSAANVSATNVSAANASAANVSADNVSATNVSAANQSRNSKSVQTVIAGVITTNQSAGASGSTNTSIGHNTGTVFRQSVSGANWQPIIAFPKRQIGKQSRNFKAEWYGKYPWIEYEIPNDSVFCHFCQSVAYDKQRHALPHKHEDTFITHGYRNWKNAIDAFIKHEESSCHIACVAVLTNIKHGINVHSKINDEAVKQRVQNTDCLRIIISTVKHLARQGLSLRGKNDAEGNLKQLLLIRSSDIPALAAWLKNKTNWTQWSVQNELLELMAHEVLRSVLSECQVFFLSNC